MLAIQSPPPTLLSHLAFFILKNPPLITIDPPIELAHTFYLCHNILNESFFYCVLTGMMKEVFSPCPPGMLVLFCWRGWDPDFVFLLQLLFPWREEGELWVIDSAFILQVFRGFEVIESLGMGDSSEMSVWCLSGMRRPLRVFACTHASPSLWGRGHGVHVLQYMVFLWPIISAHTWHLSQIDFIQL